MNEELLFKLAFTVVMAFIALFLATVAFYSREIRKLRSENIRLRRRLEDMRYPVIAWTN